MAAWGAAHGIEPVNRSLRRYATKTSIRRSAANTRRRSIRRQPKEGFDNTGAGFYLLALLRCLPTLCHLSTRSYEIGAIIVLAALTVWASRSCILDLFGGLARRAPAYGA
jgi:hypothetical protein